MNEIDVHKESLKDLTIDQLKGELIKIAESMMKKYPSSFRTILTNNPRYKAIKQLIDEKQDI